MRLIPATLLVLTLGAPGLAEAPREGSPISEVVRGNNRFALDLYGVLREEPGNLFISPASISTALAMTYGGARGETAEQMAEALHFPLPPDRLHAAFVLLVEALNADDTGRGYRLSMANRLWGQEGYDFRPEYLAITRESYGAELARVDFARDAEQARRRINAWVEERTQGKVGDLIPPNVLDPATRLVLTNAIHFKGDWSEPFREEATREAPFYTAADRSVPVPLMHRTGDYRFWAAEGLKALELPYGKGDLAMVVLLPDAVDGLADLEAGLTAEGLVRWLGNLREQEVRVSLPRFSMESRSSLADALGSLGITRAFDPDEADFSGIATQEGLFLSAVLHEAFLDVNEEGTEAAAATAVLLGPTSAPFEEEPAVFRADHPFVFLIRDVRTGAILFLGRVADPRG